VSQLRILEQLRIWSYKRTITDFSSRFFLKKFNLFSTVDLTKYVFCSNTSSNRQIQKELDTLDEALRQLELCKKPLTSSFPSVSPSSSAATTTSFGNGLAPSHPAAVTFAITHEVVREDATPRDDSFTQESSDENDDDGINL
jgi:hypothetical protein